MSIATASDSMNKWEGALCAESDPELFFPEKGGTCAPAKKICARCIHSQDGNPCLEDALAQPISYGIRGGKTARERQKILQARRLAAK